MLHEVLEVLGADKLDEKQQAVISQKIKDMIDLNSRELADKLLKEEKEALTEEFEAKYEEYKKDITSRFSDFVDSVLDEELEIPERVMEYAKKGELYSELIEQFKLKLAIDEGLLEKEVKGLLKEAKEEIVGLRKQINSYMVKESELTKDAKLLSASLYIRQKCDGLMESQKSKIYGLLEGITDKNEIDRKFKYLVESVMDKEETDDEVKDTKEKVDKKIVEEGTGFNEVKETKEMLSESTESPFNALKESWVKILKENKI